MVDVPEVTFKCDGCGEDLNILAPYLKIQVKAERGVIMASVGPMTNGDVGTPEITMNTQSGRGRIMRMHNFMCLAAYGHERKDNEISIMPHHEEGDPYVPEDNRTPEELVKDGEMTQEQAKLLNHLAENAEVTINGGDR